MFVLVACMRASAREGYGIAFVSQLPCLERLRQQRRRQQR